VAERTAWLAALGGEEGCRRLSAAFYGRVGRDPVLRRLFPGKTLRCATEEFAAFLIQFLGGDEEQTQHRWWLSLRASHARFQISETERRAWLSHMAATLEVAGLDEAAQGALREFFEHSSAYAAGRADGVPPRDVELAKRWRAQRMLDNAVVAIAVGSDEEGIALAAQFSARPGVFVGLLARMMQSGRPRMIGFVLDNVERYPALTTQRHGGRTLLHFAAAAGCLKVVDTLLRLGAYPDMLDTGGHTPLYRVANECGGASGPEIVRALVRAGADVNACGGVTRSTPLHMAARRGFAGTTHALLECGALKTARDRKGDTPYDRAMNCRKTAVAELLLKF
jgi:hemoglobin